ncbi:hypothetical protein ONS96_010716 [Cadophora gregata f. sp. sojae]|nr:hypothetical protein ONS96_010716 [Cadophora gregata f. sp. sojae]
MLHTVPFNNNDAMERPTSQPSATSPHTSRLFLNTDRRTPFQSQTLEFQQKMMPQWACYSPIPLPSPSDDGLDAGGSDYFWKDVPAISPLPQLDSTLSDVELSEDMYSLFGTSSGRRNNQTDSAKPLSQPLPYMADDLRSLPLTSNPLANRYAYLTGSDHEETYSQASDCETPPHRSEGRLIDDVRVVHNQVEQRYRHRVRDNINALWNVIPESSSTVQPSKAVVLKRAREHILELQQHVRRDKREKEMLEAKVQMLEHYLSERSGAKGLKPQNVQYAA